MGESDDRLLANYRTIPLFSELDGPELEQILSFAHNRTIERGSRIFRKGDPYTGFFVVIQGSVKVYKESKNGKEVILHLLRPPALLAEVPLFEGGDYPANADALEATELLYIDKNRFIEYLGDSPGLMRKVLVGLAKKVRVLSETIEDFTLRDVTARFARHLVQEIAKAHRAELSEPFLRFEVPWATVASQLGTARETLSRSLKRMQDTNIIRLKGHVLTVLDYNKLQELAQ